MRRDQIESHLIRCPAVQIRCDDCGSQIQRRNKESHDSSCPNKRVRCRGFTFGCSFLSIRSEVIAHEHHCDSCRLAPILDREKEKMEDSMRRQVSLLSQEMERRIEEMRKDWDIQRHQLFEKVDQLSRDLNRLVPQIGTGNVSLLSLRRRPNIPDIQTVQCGVHAVRVQFTYLSSLSSLSFQLMFCGGPFDDVLPLFPFCGSVRIILRHPSDPSLNIEGELDTDDDEEFAALVVSLHHNPSDLHGWEDFALYEDVRDNVGEDGLLRYDLIVKWKKVGSEYRTRKRKRSARD